MLRFEPRDRQAPPAPARARRALVVAAITAFGTFALVAWRFGAEPALWEGVAAGFLALSGTLVALREARRERVPVRAAGAPERRSKPREGPETLEIQNRVLRYERQALSHVLDVLADGVVHCDPLGEVLYANRAAGDLLDLDHEAIRGLSIDEIHPQIGPALARLDGTARLGSGSRGGQRRSIAATRSALGTGEGAGTLFTLRDVTAQESAERTQVEFLSQIAHELKAPLNTIVTYADALADSNEVSAEDRDRFFNTITGETQRMGALITNLLEISRIRLGNLTARFGFVKTATLLREIAGSFAAQAEAQGQHLTISVPDNLPPLHGDKDLLGVAISNLVSNALKYTPPGGTISVGAECTATTLTLEVADTGVGIPRDVLPKIFEQFTRSEQAEVRGQPGSGLGLSLVEEIASVHGGNVSVESELGTGSVFRMALPVRTVGERLDVAAA